MSTPNAVLTDLYDRVAESVPDLLEGLSADEAAWQPHAGANSIGWLVWHLTRVLDDHVVDGQMDQEQVLTAKGYDERLALPLPAEDTGYGHTAEQVALVRVEDVSVLADYHAAVQAEVADYLASVGDLDEVIDDRWDPPVTRLVRLVSVADDMTRHVGQAAYVRGLLEHRDG